MLLNATNNALCLPPSFCLVYCAGRDCLTVLCSSLVPSPEPSATWAGQRVSEKQVEELITAVVLCELDLSTGEIEELAY